VVGGGLTAAVRGITEEIKKGENMRGKKKDILCVFDNASVMADAIDAVMEDYKKDIAEFTYLQVDVNTDVTTSECNLRDMKREMFDMLRSDMMPHARNQSNREEYEEHERPKQTLHVLDLKVKAVCFEKIDRLLWSAGGFQSRRSKGWFRSRSKKNITFIWNMKQFFRTLANVSKKRSNV